MIRIYGIPSPIQASDVTAASPLQPMEQYILESMISSTELLVYNSMDELIFELVMRNAVIESAYRLNASDADFAVFSESRCNPAYWSRTENGGFQLFADTSPSKAIEDIFTNGSAYGFECATAIIIVYYGAVLKVLGMETFDKLFANLYLRDWQHDKDLRLMTKKYMLYLPGDVRYIKNPDYDPSRPQWQGENIVDLGKGLYYGHGIGIRTAEEIIQILNRLRRPGAQRSAYMLDQATRLGYSYLAQYYKPTNSRMNRTSDFFPYAIKAQIGQSFYVQ